MCIYIYIHIYIYICIYIYIYRERERERDSSADRGIDAPIVGASSGFCELTGSARRESSGVSNHTVPTPNSRVQFICPYAQLRVVGIRAVIIFLRRESRGVLFVHGEVFTP